MTKEVLDYAKLTQELDELVHKLQDNDLAIDAAIALHTRGQEIIVQLENYLKSAENTIKLIASDAKA